MPQTLTDTSVRSLADLPSPKGLPLIGNLLQLAPERLHLTLEQWSRELGSMYTIDLGTKRALVCCDPELAHAVLQRVARETLVATGALWSQPDTSLLQRAVDRVGRKLTDLQ